MGRREGKGKEGGGGGKGVTKGWKVWLVEDLKLGLERRKGNNIFPPSSLRWKFLTNRRTDVEFQTQYHPDSERDFKGDFRKPISSYTGTNVYTRGTEVSSQPASNKDQWAGSPRPTGALSRPFCLAPRKALPQHSVSTCRLSAYRL